MPSNGINEMADTSKIITSVRACANCVQWTPLAAKTPEVGACRVKNRLTSRLAICAAFSSKIVQLDKQKATP